MSEKFFSVWVAGSNVLVNDYQSGNLPEQVYDFFQSVIDDNVVSGLFKKPVLAGKTWRLRSLTLTNTKFNKAVVDWLLENYPSDFYILGAWRFEDGLLAGTRYDENGEIVGTPLYPVHPQTWRFMPDTYEYDAEGNVTATIPATSNADLRDINLINVQTPRKFS